MAITRVQGNARGTAVSGTTIAVTLGAAPTAGNVLVAVIGNIREPARTVTSITETNVTWTKQVSNIYGTNYGVEIWLGVVAADASTSITVTFSDTLLTYGAVADICEYSGIASTPLDKTATAGNVTNAPLTGTTAETTVAVELWIGGVASFKDGTPPDMSNPINDFTLLDGVTYNYIDVGYLEKIVSAVGTANSGVSLGNSQTWVGCIATFKGATGGVSIPIMMHHYNQMSKIHRG